MAAIAKSKDPALRSDAAGTLQALVGLWQIFVPAAESFPRRRPTPPSPASSAASPQMHGNRDLFDAGRNGVKLLLGATGRRQRSAREDARPAGRQSPTDSETHEQMVQDMIRIFEAQRIVSLDTPVPPGRPPGSRSEGREARSHAGQQARLPHRRNPVAARLADRRRKECDGLSATGPTTTSMPSAN